MACGIQAAAAARLRPAHKACTSANLRVVPLVTLTKRVTNIIFCDPDGQELTLCEKVS